MRRIGVFPGSFDPIHHGHLDLIERGLRLVDDLYVAVLVNDEKRPLFSVDERLDMLRALLAVHPGCRVESFSGLLVEFAHKVGAQAVVRGLRGAADLDYEQQMTQMNRHLQPAVDTIFLLPRPQFAHLSSRLIKEVCGLGGSIEGLLPESIKTRLVERLANGR